MDLIIEFVPEEPLMVWGFREHLWMLTYRVSAYAMFNLLDDPAMLAFALC